MTERRLLVTLGVVLALVCALLTWGVTASGEHRCWSVTVGTNMMGYSDIEDGHVKYERVDCDASHLRQIGSRQP